MNKNQARAMLAFISDLYIVIQTPDEPIKPPAMQNAASVANGKTRVREAQSVATTD